MKPQESFVNEKAKGVRIKEKDKRWYLRKYC